MQNTKSLLLIKIFNNDEKLYAGGDLWYYAKKLFNAKNVNNGFHGYDHMTYVVCEVYDAIKTMSINPVYARVLLIAAIFHDYGHSGDGCKPDSFNIERAVKAVKTHLQKSDKDHIKLIISWVRSTEWSSIVGHNTLEQDMFINILRDADMSYMFSDSWMHFIIFGLGKEQKKSPREMIELQIPFLEHKVKFYSPWGKAKFGKRIPARIAEMKIWQEKMLGTKQ